MKRNPVSAVLILYLVGHSIPSSFTFIHATPNEEKEKVMEIRRKSSHPNSKKRSPQSDVSRKRKYPNMDQKSIGYTNHKDALKQWLDSLPIQVLRTPNRAAEHDPTLFLKWCEKVLGIQTLLKIDMFNYTNHLLEWQQDYLKRHEEDEKEEGSVVDGNTTAELCNTTLNNMTDTADPKESHIIIRVRGLAASRDIQEGETIISIPVDKLISIHNTIDKDPILSRILGVDARLNYGWAHIVLHDDGKQVVEEDPYYEIPLLAVAILYHQSLGAELSPIWNYISSLLSSPTHTIPFLLNTTQLNQKFPEGVRNLSLRIQHDVKEMYDSVMVVLMEDYAQVFGPSSQQDPIHMFSFEKFIWAFAIVNSHYWHLGPVSQWSTTLPSTESDKGFGVPNEQKQQSNKDTTFFKHSFLAPFADLLNFGPPCTRAMINTETNSFDIVAVCPYASGQEVTFYYSDDCEDIIIANYGFSHPMIPRCPTMEDLKVQNTQLKDQAETLTDKLISTQNKLMEVEEEILRLRHGCNCNCGDSSHEVLFMESSTTGMRGNNRDDSEKSEGTHGRIRRITRRSMEEIGL